MSRDDICWFHGKLSRESAEEILKQEGKEDGAFLVRESNTATGDFVLTLLHQGEVWHYQIRRHGEDAFFSIDDKMEILHGLDTLIEFYRQSKNGLIAKLGVHIKKDPPPNDSRIHGLTNLLHRATKENNEHIVSELLTCGYRNLDAKNQDGQTAVHLAALYCEENILKLLLNQGVNVNCMDTFSNTPLHYACRSKSGAFVQTLVKAGANVQGRNIKNGYVPLHEAAKHGNLEAVKVLLAANAPLLPRTNSGEFPIDLAKETQQAHVVAFLNDYKQPPAHTFELQWYHGTLKRDEAVEVLNTYASNLEAQWAAMETPTEEGTPKASTPRDSSGCFLVRYSDSKASGSGYVLTMLWNKIVKNFLIGKSSNYLYIDDGPYLPSLEHLVEHFMRFADGLPVSLKYPVLPKPKPPLPLFCTMPRSSNSLKTPSIDMIPTSPTSPKDHSLFLAKAEDLLRSPPIEKHAQTLSHRKKPKEGAATVFHTLMLRSPIRSTIMDSLLKPKGKMPKDEDKASPIDELEFRRAGKLLKDISFSTEFSNLHMSDGEQTASPSGPDDCFYNVPQNNAAVSATPEAEKEAELAVQSKTEEEVEYFTKSDVAIEKERLSAILEKEQEQPSRPKGGVGGVLTSNGYIQTFDIRVFHGQSDASLAASAAQLRDFSNHPERLDSFLSTGSRESEMLRYLNRHNDSTEAQVKCFIPAECLTLDTIIGEGEFGSVYRGYLQTETQRCEVAIKTLRDEHCRRNKQEFLREASVMIRLSHHCIVQLIGISKGETLMMVQEIVPLGSMLEFILAHKGKINPDYELKLWASQIACGMQYLESHHYVHRDLAARNILLASRNQAKISDFGLSRALGTENDCYQASQGGKWPIKWYAPESFNSGLFSHASDVWSFGVTLWEMFSMGDPPYGDIRAVDAIKLIEKGERLAQPSLCPPHVYEIMKSCWLYKPKDRPTFRYLTDFFANDSDYQNLVELIKTDHIS